jgi:hypothetical protein
MRALIVVLMLSAAVPAAAEDLRPFCAERPGKATPPCILDAGHAQLEVGLADAVLQPHDNTFAFGAAELRLGLTRRAEAEFGWTPLITGQGTGVGDASVGLRWALTDPDRDGTAVSAQVFATAPTATHGFGAGGWSGGVRLPLSVSLGGLSLGATAEGDVLRDGDGRGTHRGGSLTLAAARTFGALSLGAELWGFVDDDPAGRTRQASFDLTAARSVGDNAQMDAGVNLGLNRATPDVEVYAGVARRF